MLEICNVLRIPQRTVCGSGSQCMASDAFRSVANGKARAIGRWKPKWKIGFGIEIVKCGVADVLTLLARFCWGNEVGVTYLYVFMCVF